MDISSTIIGLVCLAIFTVPVIYITLRQHARRKDFSKYFLGQAAQQQLQLSEHDVWGRYSGIGVDKAKSKVFYLQKNGTLAREVVLDLREVARCQAESRRMNGGPTADRLELVVKFRNTKPTEALEFYDKDHNLSLMEELKLMKKWEATINLLSRQA